MRRFCVYCGLRRRVFAVLGAPNTSSASICVPTYDANGHQKSAKPKPTVQGGRDVNLMLT